MESTDEFKRDRPAETRQAKHLAARREIVRRPDWTAENRKKSIYPGTGVLVDRPLPKKVARARPAQPDEHFEFVHSCVLDYKSYIDLDYIFKYNSAPEEEASQSLGKEGKSPELSLANTAVDVKELPASYVFVVEVPGLKSSDVKLQIENETILKISGEFKREDPLDVPQIKYVRQERPGGRFLRKFNVPPNVVLDGVTASCLYGLLTVTIPKVPPKEPQKPKNFEIQVETLDEERVASIKSS